MKTLVLISLFFAGCCRIISQPPPPGTNVANNYLNKFEGTWRWVNGSDTLTLRLKKKNTTFNNYTEDVLMGTHRYVQNGSIVEDAMNKFDSISINERKSTVLLYKYQDTDTSKVRGSLRDLTKQKRSNLFLQLVDGGTPTLVWHLEAAEGTFIDPNFQYGLTMPRDIVLTKL
jgi:hypothetical protein